VAKCSPNRTEHSLVRCRHNPAVAYGLAENHSLFGEIEPGPTVVRT
jgi:hypothetical protein